SCRAASDRIPLGRRAPKHIPPRRSSGKVLMAARTFAAVIFPAIPRRSLSSLPIPSEHHAPSEKAYAGRNPSSHPRATVLRCVQYRTRHGVVVLLSLATRTLHHPRV